MATKYECPSCGATMSLASTVSSVKCPVCRVDMSAVGEVETAKITPPVKKPVAPPAPQTATAPTMDVPAGIKIAKAVTDHTKTGASGTGPIAAANADAAARKLMDSARSEADKVIQQAEQERAEILAHAETHAREQVEAFFDQARKEAAEIENQAKAEAEKIVAAAKRDAEKVAGEEARKLAVLQTQVNETSQKLSTKHHDAENDQVEETKAAAHPPEENMGKGARNALTDTDIAALTKEAVETAIRREREKNANKDLNSKKQEANQYAKREARFLFAGSVFGALVLAYSAFTLSQSSAAALKVMSLAMMGVDGLLFLGLVGVIIGHYKAGNEVKKKVKVAKEGKKSLKPETPADVKKPASKRAQLPKASMPSPPKGANGPGSSPEGGKIPLKVKMKTGKSTGEKGKPPASDALRKAAMRAAAKRAAKKK